LRCTCQNASRDAWNEALEAAAGRCDDRARSLEVLVDRGKGAHGQAGYVQESTWNAWNGERFGAYRLAATIRAMKRPQPANVRPAGGDEAAAAPHGRESGDAAQRPAEWRSVDGGVDW
jgi:hypothetical protein